MFPEIATTIRFSDYLEVIRKSSPRTGKERNFYGYTLAALPLSPFLLTPHPDAVTFGARH